MQTALLHHRVTRVRLRLEDVPQVCAPRRVLSEHQSFWRSTCSQHGDVGPRVPSKTLGTSPARKPGRPSSSLLYTMTHLTCSQYPSRARGKSRLRKDVQRGSEQTQLPPVRREREALAAGPRTSVPCTAILPTARLLHLSFL
ncbi:hypothetical protein O3P69_020515 [Scylla paramamosain]|uniref:Uncharacterized protein n=1 Tax=Scylla paramamosain TaxID=85552 RepID=A0AAW0TQE3_SCYPA